MMVGIAGSTRFFRCPGAHHDDDRFVQREHPQSPDPINIKRGA